MNFDIAEHVDKETSGLWTARPSNSEGIDEIRYTPVGAGSVAFPLAPEKKGTKPSNLKWLPGDEWSLAPKIELKPEVRSGGNGSCTFGKAGVELGTSGSEGTASHKRNRRAAGKLAKVLDKEVGISFTGGPLTLSWNPQSKRWVAEEVSFGGEVSGSIGLTHHYPTAIGPVFLEVKGELALAGEFKVSGIDSALGGAGWGGLESSFTLSSERLPKVTVAGGYGINNVACVKGSLSGMSVLEATHSKGTWTDVRWGIKGQGSLTAKALVLEATLFEVNSQTYWFVNNSSQVAFRAFGAPGSDLEWRLQPRDYLSSPKKGMRLMSAPGGTDFAIVESGGYPDPAPAMASGVAGDALAYLRDDGTRTSANRTELVLRVGTSNEWGAAESVWNDGTADFMPSLAAMPDGSFAAAWMNASRTFSDDVAIDEFCGAEEIAVGVRNAATGTWTCRNLTDDGAFDFSPVVRAAANGKVLVMWLRNASGKMASSAAEPTDIMAAVYSGGAWGEATVVQGGVGIVNGFDVAFDGDNAVLAFSKDADGDPATVGDAEICALRSSGGVWGEPTRLTAAGDADGMPLVRTVGGSFAVLWTAKGTLMETAELSISNAVAVAAADGWTLPANPVMIRGAGGCDAIVWNGVSAAGGAADAPTAMMYDPVCGAWGSPTKLFDDERRESRLSGAVGSDGGLRVGYESASVATNAVGEVSLGATEIRTRFIPAVCDLAVVEDGFSFSTDEFTAGEEVFLTVQAANLGFCLATNVTVKVYEEKDDAKAELASIVTNFPGGGVVAVKVPWVVDNTQTNLKFTVEIDAGANFEAEEAKGNNVYSWSAGTSDVSIGTVVARNENATRRLLTATVVNKGLGPLPAGAKVVFRRGGADGEIIAEDVVGTVWPGENGVYDASFAWNLEGVAFTSEWETVCIQLFTDGTIGDALGAADIAFTQIRTTYGMGEGDETPIVRTVTFNANGGSLVGAPNKVQVQDGKAIGMLPEPTRKNYKFLGWYTAKSGGTKVSAKTKATGDMTLYAHWASAWTVTWNANGGKIGSATTSKVIVQKGKAVGTLPKATKKGYAFKGWYTKKSGGTKIKTTTKIAKNVTYYAQWTANKYTIKFNKNGGKGKMKALSATYGKNVKLTANAFKRTGYKFAGWAKSKKGKVAYKNKAKVKNLTATNGKTVTLYAVWKKAKASSVKLAATAANPAASLANPATAVAAVPAWAVGTFYGGDEGAFTTITVYKAGKVSGKVLFADGKWTIVGKASGQRIEAVVTDADGVDSEVVFAIVKTPDGHCRIESEDGLIWAE